GSFSSQTFRTGLRCHSRTGPRRRPNGYQSSSIKTAGKTRVVAFASNAAANNPSDTASQPADGCDDWLTRTARKYAQTDHNAKNPDTTSRRSVAQTTDSTRNGWTANSTAESAAQQDTMNSGWTEFLSVSRNSRRLNTKRLRALATCQSMLVRW